MYVSHYLVTRHYGGPEEGGWWYDRYKFNGTIAHFYAPTMRDDAQLLASALNQKAKDEKRQPSGTYQGRFSVANHTDDVYIAEEAIGRQDTHDQPRPHYE